MRDILKTSEYDFLRTNEHLGDNICLLGLGGSHAYGTNIESSDIDIRGIALNSKREILTGRGFEQVEDSKTDTVVYSFNKIVSLLTNTNPNTIEVLGLKPEHYLYISPIGQEILDNKKLFLSKACINSFGGYANQQLMKLKNNIARYTMSQSEKENHILRSILNSMYSIHRKYHKMPEGGLTIYIDDAVQEDMESEIFIDVNLKHYPLRDYKSIWSELNNIVKDYSKIGKRNKKKDDVHLAKHMMHLLRLYMMCIDILEKEEIITYREKEHDLLMSVRRGAYLSEGKVLDDFWDILNEYEKKFEYAKKNTSLPDKPRYDEIEEFKASVNERIVRGETDKKIVYYEKGFAYVSR